MTETELRLQFGDGEYNVSAVLCRPQNAHCLLVLGHGAGAGMRHRTMEALSQSLYGSGAATLRYQFPYMELGSGPPDRQPVAIATVRAAIDQAARSAPDLPLFAGGRSFGGRMTSHAAASAALPGVRGIVFFAFPLHPAGNPGTSRSNHLEKVAIPLLFLQGTRDALAEIELIRPVVDRLGERATLHVIEGADHSFHMLKRSGRTDDEVLVEVATTVGNWTKHITHHWGRLPATPIER